MGALQKQIRPAHIESINCLIDLHLHLDGSLSLDSVRQLAAMQGISVPEREAELVNILRAREDCNDLNEYLEKFAFPGKLLQTEEAIALSVYNLCEELKQQGLIYAEIRFAPQLHLEKGLSQRQVIAAAVEGLKRSDFPAGLILCCMRFGNNKQANLETVRLAGEFLGEGVLAVDLAGAEALYPTENFCEEFHLARELGIPYTIHAGEAAGPESVHAALELGTKRLGHGVRSLEDAALVSRLASEGITLELCPTSNLQTRMFNSIREYPIRTYLESGVKITVNTDNMTVSNTTLKREWQILTDAFALTREEIKSILLNAVDASFAEYSRKEILREKINAELN